MRRDTTQNAAGRLRGRVWTGFCLGLFWGLLWASSAQSQETGAQPAGAPVAEAQVAEVQGGPSRRQLQEEDLWYVVELLGQRSGYFHEETRRGFDDTDRELWQTDETLYNQLTRLNGGVEEKVVIRSQTRRWTTLDGATVRIENELDQGAGPARSVLHVEGAKAKILVAGTTGERAFEIPWDEASLGPQSALEALERLRSGAEESVRYQVFSFEAGNVVLDMEAKVLERREDGAVLVEQRFGGLGATARELYDARGTLLRQEIGPVVLRLADREEALLPLEATLDAFGQIVVTLDRPLASPRTLKVGRYRIRPRPGAEGIQWRHLFASDGRQRWLEGAVGPVLEVRVPEGPWRDGEAFEREAYLRSSSLIESDDPEIMALAVKETAKGAGEERDPAAAARRLERWVRDHVGFRGAGIGLASARQTLDSRDGDCTENAFLLAALLRAARIPSRVVVGLVATTATEAGTPFVPHAWTEAWVGGGWLALDSAVWAPQVDATHLAMAKSDGAEEGALVQVTAPLLQGMGRFDLEWVEIPEKDPPLKEVPLPSSSQQRKVSGPRRP